MRGREAYVALVAVGLAACTPHEGESGAIGSSPGAGGSLASSLTDGGAAAHANTPSPIPSDFRTAMTRVDAARFLSRGHAGGRWEVDVYADSASATALRADHGAVAPGARFIEEHFERGDGGAGPIMMMEKRPAGFDPEHGDWRYVVVGAHGDVVKDGPVETCAGCHGDAPRDHLFRVDGP